MPLLPPGFALGANWVVFMVHKRILRLWETPISEARSGAHSFVADFRYSTRPKARTKTGLAFVVSHRCPKSGEGRGTRLCGLGEESESLGVPAAWWWGAASGFRAEFGTGIAQNAAKTGGWVLFCAAICNMLLRLRRFLGRWEVAFIAFLCTFLTHFA